MDYLNPSNDAAFTARTASYTGTAGTTSTWPPGPGGVLVFTTTAAYVKVGVGVTATTASTPLPANVPVLLKVPQGTDEPWRVSAIQIASGGDVYAKPMDGAG